MHYRSGVDMRGYTSEEIRLVGNVVIGIHPAFFRSVRGRTLLAVVFDESAFWRDETSEGLRDRYERDRGRIEYLDDLREVEE